MSNIASAPVNVSSCFCQECLLYWKITRKLNGFQIMSCSFSFSPWNQHLFLFFTGAHSWNIPSRHDEEEDTLWPWKAKKWQSLRSPITLSCPLASAAGSCRPPVINLRQDVSRQLSSQSLLSLSRYRSVLCYRLSWLLPPRYWCFRLGEKERKLPRPEFTEGSFSNDLQSPRDENRSCQVGGGVLFSETVAGSHYGAGQFDKW